MMMMMMMMMMMYRFVTAACFCFVGFILLAVTSQEIAWEECPQNELSSLEWDVKP